jgi:hypothetical protein
MRLFNIFIFTLLFICQSKAQQMTPEIAARLTRLPLACINQEWPNKTSHMSIAATDHVLLPSELHPAFYGCLDWHSSVHGHWLLVKILKDYPNISNRDSIIACLDNSFQDEKIAKESAYFKLYTSSNTYERTYGWAWLLKLDEELSSWDNPKARQWHKSLQPLTLTIEQLWKDYLPKQTYPNRTGVHPNTAFGLAFALDWARAVSDHDFEKLIMKKSMEFYFGNSKVPAYFEPDASDFFSPTLEVADLMRRILSKQEFSKWFNHYYDKRSIAQLITLPVVSDKNDYQTVHLVGLSFSRAWCMKGIANSLPANNSKSKLFKSTADVFIKNALPEITNDNYGGSHWLATFAFYAMQ